MGTDSVSVTTDSAGVPVYLIWGGRQWSVAAEPVRWFERVSWWERERRFPLGGDKSIDLEIWQVQARLGRNPQNALTTFELIRERNGAGWSIRSASAAA